MCAEFYSVFLTFYFIKRSLLLLVLILFTFFFAYFVNLYNQLSFKLFFSGSNVFRLLALREISPRTKYLSKRLWGEASKCSVRSNRVKSEGTDPRHGLISWYSIFLFCRTAGHFLIHMPYFCTIHIFENFSSLEAAAYRMLCFLLIKYILKLVNHSELVDFLITFVGICGVVTTIVFWNI